MVKLTYPRSTSRGHGTPWDLNSGRGIRIPHWVPLYHGPTSVMLLSSLSNSYYFNQWPFYPRAPYPPYHQSFFSKFIYYLEEPKIKTADELTGKSVIDIRQVIGIHLKEILHSYLWVCNSFIVHFENSCPILKKFCIFLFFYLKFSPIPTPPFLFLFFLHFHISDETKIDASELTSKILPILY